jgi:hypothetical protein
MSFVGRAGEQRNDSKFGLALGSLRKNFEWSIGVALMLFGASGRPRENIIALALSVEIQRRAELDPPGQKCGRRGSHLLAPIFPISDTKYIPAYRSYRYDWVL